VTADNGVHVKWKGASYTGPRQWVPFLVTNAVQPLAMVPLFTSFIVSYFLARHPRSCVTEDDGRIIGDNRKIPVFSLQDRRVSTPITIHDDLITLAYTYTTPSTYHWKGH